MSGIEPGPGRGDRIGGHRRVRRRVAADRDDLAPRVVAALLAHCDLDAPCSVARNGLAGQAWLTLTTRVTAPW